MRQEDLVRGEEGAGAAGQLPLSPPVAREGESRRGFFSRAGHRVAMSVRRNGLALIGLLLVAAVWEFIGRVVVTDRLLFAPFTTTIAQLWKLLTSGAILPDLKASAEEFLLGYGIAAVLGVLIGAGFAASSLCRQIFSAAVQAGYATPIVAIAPMITVLFGIGLQSKVIVVAALAIFPIVIGTESALTGINPEYLETAQAFGASRLETLRKVVFPAAAAGVMTGLRLGVGRGIIGVVVAEFFGATTGLGFLLISYANEFQATNVLAVVVLLALIGVLSNSLLLAVERRVTPWSRGGDE